MASDPDRTANDETRGSGIPGVLASILVIGGALTIVVGLVIVVFGPFFLGLPLEAADAASIWILGGGIAVLAGVGLAFLSRRGQRRRAG